MDEEIKDVMKISAETLIINPEIPPGGSKAKNMLKIDVSMMKGDMNARDLIPAFNPPEMKAKRMESASSVRSTRVWVVKERTAINPKMNTFVEG